MTSVVPLVAFCVAIRCGLTQTGILEKLPDTADTWYINQNSQAINGRTHQVRKESTECTCTCAVKVDTPTGEGHRKAGETQDLEGLEGGGGWLNAPEDVWSSDGQAEEEEEEESPVNWSPADDHSLNDDQHEPPFYTEDNADNNNNNNNKNKMVDNALDKEAPDRYKGYSWGHGSRYPWKSLKDTMCIRHPCKADSECCFRWNICDKSAKVCTNCWYGHPCLSERDCCFDFPFCQRKWKTDENGRRLSVESGRCADQR